MFLPSEYSSVDEPLMAKIESIAKVTVSRADGVIQTANCE